MYDEYGTPVQKPRRNRLPTIASVLIIGLLIYQGLRLIKGPDSKPLPPTPVAMSTPAPLPTEHPDYLNLGYDAFEQGDYQTALEYYTQALEFDTDDATIFIYRADAYYRLGDYERALADYNRAVELAPSGWLYNNRGLTYAALGEDAKAIADYGRAMTADNDEPHLAYNNRGVVYYHQTNYDAALKDFTQAIELQPDYALAYFNRGLTYHSQNEFDRALLDYNVTLEYKPDYPEAYNNRGLIYDEQGDYTQAIADFTRSLELGNAEPHIVYSNRGLSYLSLEKYGLAKNDFKRAIEANPTDPYAYNNRGWANYLQGNYAEAIPDYELSLEYGNEEPWVVYDNLALAYFKLGDTDEAFKQWGIALMNDPEYVEIYRSRGDAYYDLGEFDKARRDYRMYEQLHGTLETYMAERLK